MEGWLRGYQCFRDAALTRQSQSELFGGIAGAVAGALWADQLGAPTGAAAGAVAGWVCTKLLFSLTPLQRLKRRIVVTLISHDVMQVRDVMSQHGLYVPKDCFSYSPDLPFVVALWNYRRAFEELEEEGRAAHSVAASVSHGYVDAPYDWINHWSGRAYRRG